ncbi:TIGR03752 family integrating conjugative element protein [Pseudomonas sp. CDFA 553]|uniref:TIGR03752 family integrating conjugative element protein n=1 Tax=Pseudomonas quasicaspiana TaxID=2829821 RepID=UPI001E5CF498|nr:TIGR03752 family integrating conjugative element protein [Pseudomonas quasicaspiana]MCD5986491.1 TIGR03752 family integrating conjugative element protein [Pseudomonas quasicaspiana]
MKSNGLIKWLVLPALLLLLFFMVRSCSSDKSPNAESSSTVGQLSPEELKRLGIHGDTPMDTVATLVGQTKAMREELQTLLSENKTQKDENDRLRSRESDVDQRIRSALNGEIEQLRSDRTQFDQEKQTTRNLLSDLKEQFNTRGLAPNNSDLPVGLGLQQGDGDGFRGGEDNLIWIDPQDGTALDAQGKPIGAGTSKPAVGFNFPNAFADQINMGQRELKAKSGAVGRNIKTDDDKPPPRPVYTLPENSTLMGSVAMTALIGRVPVDGTVNDPFPFKILIGPDNLTANGIDLPDVAGAVISGTAAGDWTLSCVRGQITSMTFVFNDGRVRTVPQPQPLTTKQNNGGQSSGQMDKIQGGIGWISDPNGIPCISGLRRSNAEQYIGSKSLVTAAGAGVAKLLEADQANTGTVISSNGTTVGTMGGAGSSALSSILSAGVKDIGDWVNKLYGQAFAAIYVQPGAQVAVHLDRQLEIDYEPDGRKVKYPSGGAHASALD